MSNRSKRTAQCKRCRNSISQQRYNNPDNLHVCKKCYPEEKKGQQ